MLNTFVTEVIVDMSICKYVVLPYTYVMMGVYTSKVKNMCSFMLRYTTMCQASYFCVLVRKKRRIVRDSLVLSRYLQWVFDTHWIVLLL